MLLFLQGLSCLGFSIFDFFFVCLCVLIIWTRTRKETNRKEKQGDRNPFLIPDIDKRKRGDWRPF